jgi:hypothetical protein
VLVATCIRKGLGLKAHRVAAVREDGDVIVAEIERIGRRLRPLHRMRAAVPQRLHLLEQRMRREPPLPPGYKYCNGKCIAQTAYCP